MGRKPGRVKIEGKREKGLTVYDGAGNIGARAAQVVPHVHFHVIPRPGDVPEIENRSWTVFGKGQREELDEEDAVGLAARMREELAVEIRRVKEREGVDLDVEGVEVGVRRTREKL